MAALRGVIAPCWAQTSRRHAVGGKRDHNRISKSLCVWAVASSVLFSIAASPAFSAEPEKPTFPTCTLEPGAIHTVARIIDAETVVLDDGSEVRLIGALAPRATDSGATAGAWPAENDAIRVLSDLVLGHTVKLAYGGRHTDRYGRHLAHLFLNDNGKETWVQGEMLSAGAARAYGLPGSFACATEMLANESLARTTRRGLWDVAIYQPKPSHLTALLLSRRSRFEIVEGVVSSISRTKSGLYLNFSSDWKADFTARVSKDILAANPDWDDTLADIAGKRVRVRGWIERRNGPMIDIRDPGQLEIEDAPSAAPAVSELPAADAAKPANASGEGPAAGPASSPGSGRGKNEKRPAIPERKSPGAVNL
jgi:micrococcal nuclease